MTEPRPARSDRPGPGLRASPAARIRTVLGSGVAAAAAALFAARHGPVLLAGRTGPGPAPSVEGVPAATLTLLLELGITPSEVDVRTLLRRRSAAWETEHPRHDDGPACAHLDRAALHRALWTRVREHPKITVTTPLRGTPETVRAAATGPFPMLDATGGRARTSPSVRRAPRVWIATSVTVPVGEADPGLRLAAAPDGYAWRLGSATHLTIGWAGPGTPPRDGADVWRRITGAGAGWLLDDVPRFPAAAVTRRPCSLAVPEDVPGTLRIGDAGLTRDALASQGLSLGLSDACLAAHPSVTEAEFTARRDDALRRHVRHLNAALGACRFAGESVWAGYRTWVSCRIRSDVVVSGRCGRADTVPDTLHAPAG